MTRAQIAAVEILAAQGAPFGAKSRGLWTPIRTLDKALADVIASRAARGVQILDLEKAA